MDSLPTHRWVVSSCPSIPESIQTSLSPPSFIMLILLCPWSPDTLPSLLTGLVASFL